MKSINELTTEEMLEELSKDERFRATIAAMNGLLMAKGIYSAHEFDGYLRESMKPRLERQREGSAS